MKKSLKTRKVLKNVKKRWKYFFRKIIHQIKHEVKQNLGDIYEVRHLKGSYIEIIKSHKYFKKCHVSQFVYNLKGNILQTKVFSFGKKLTLFFG